MKTTTTLLLLVSWILSTGQSLNKTINNIVNPEQARQFIMANPLLKGEIVALNTNTDSSALAKKIFSNTTGQPITIQGHTYKTVKIKTEVVERVSYLFLDGVKLRRGEIDSLRQDILTQYKAGNSFSTLAKTYTMDGNPNPDLGWYTEAMMIPEFWNTVKQHRKGDVFTIDAPAKKWYYVVLKTHEDREMKTYSVLKISNSAIGYGAKILPNKTQQQDKNAILVEDPQFVATKDTVSSSGPESITRNIIQDKNGHYWLATWQGIIRYDGKLFTNFTLKENLQHFHAFSILEDKKGNIWFGTILGGLFRYDGKNFSHFTTKDGLVDNSVMCIMEDRAGNIWTGTTNGLSRFNGKTFTNFTTAEGLSGNAVYDMKQDGEGTIWIGTAFGVDLYDGESFLHFKQKNKSISGVRSILEDKAGNIWIGSQDGLSRFDGETLTNIAPDFTTNIIQDKDGIFWMSQSDKDTNKMKLIRYDGTSFSTITTELQVFGITADKIGNIWFGTASGIRRYDGKIISSFISPH